MRTRSQSKRVTINEQTFDIFIPNDIVPTYEVNIDFNEASNAWLANKKRQSDATYTYICLGQTKTGNECNKPPLQNSNYCSCHKNK